MSKSGSPACVLLFSGKRKSGKDFLTDALYEKLGEKISVIVKLSGPIKKHWAKEQGVSLDDLLGSGVMKEEHRKAMVDWSQGLRYQNPGYFCEAALDMYSAHNKSIWIVSDARRKSDLIWFMEKYGDRVLKFKITAGDDVRTGRGWISTPGIDDAETECDLDDFTDWTSVVCNDGNTDSAVLVTSIIHTIKASSPALSTLLSHI